MIRGIDYVTIEVFGLGQPFRASIKECQELIDENPAFKDFDAKVLQHREGTGYIDVALYPKDGNKRKFIKDIKRYGYIS